MISNKKIALIVLLIFGCVEDPEQLTCEEETQPCKDEALEKHWECEKEEYDALPEKDEDEPWLYFCAYHRGLRSCGAALAESMDSCQDCDDTPWDCLGAASRKAELCLASCANGIDSVPICLDQFDADNAACY